MRSKLTFYGTSPDVSEVIFRDVLLRSSRFCKFPVLVHMVTVFGFSLFVRYWLFIDQMSKISLNVFFSYLKKKREITPFLLSDQH